DGRGEAEREPGRELATDAERAAPGEQREREEREEVRGDVARRRERPERHAARADHDQHDDRRPAPERAMHPPFERDENTEEREEEDGIQQMRRRRAE